MKIQCDSNVNYAARHMQPGKDGACPQTNAENGSYAGLYSGGFLPVASSAGKTDGAKNEDSAPDRESSDQTKNEVKFKSELISESGSVIAGHGDHVIYCLTVIGQIEGHYILPSQNKTTKYEHVIPQLVAIEEDPKIDGLLMLLNTVGGDIEAGLAIAELVAGMRKPTVSLVLGGGHSIGVPLAVAARHSFIAPTASMTIHPVRVNGLILGVPQTLEYFKKMQDRITGFVTENSHITAQRFLQLAMNTEELVMDVGTILEGSEAVQEGLIDSLGTLSDALERLYAMIDEDRLKRLQSKTGASSESARIHPRRLSHKLY